MPVKVRCPECETAVNAPDKARGKAVRCPNCEAKISVPAAAKSPAKAKAKRSAADEHDAGFLGRLDLDRVEDHHARICPRCGSDVPEDAAECPKCFVNVETGTHSTKAKKKLERGVDPDLYYKTLWGSGWRWVADNKKVTTYTVLIVLVSSLLLFGAAFMVVFCSKVPLKVFWSFIALVAATVPPGWAWHLDTVTIRTSMKKKTKLHRDDTKFDFFLSAATGLKAAVWTLFTVFPLVGLIVGMMMREDNPAAAYAVMGASFLPTLLLIPPAMTHMCMPVTYRGWLIHQILKEFGRTAGACLFWFVLLVVTLIPVGGLVAVIGIVFGEDLSTFVRDVDKNSRIDAAKSVIEAHQESASTNRKATPEEEKLAQEKEVEVEWGNVTVPLILWCVACVPLGIALVYNTRTNGQYAYYFRGDLDLITMEKEVVFVKKADKVDEFGEKIPAGQGEAVVKWFLGIGGTVLFYVVLNVVVYFATGGKYLILPRPIAQALNLMND